MCIGHCCAVSDVVKSQEVPWEVFCDSAVYSNRGFCDNLGSLDNLMRRHSGHLRLSLSRGVDVVRVCGGIIRSKRLR